MKKNDISNPFVLSGYHSPELFCNREKETERIITALKNNRNLTIYSLRRIGKTMLIHHALNQIINTSGKYNIIYIDIFPTTNLNDFVNVLAKEVIVKSRSKPEQLLKTIGKIFSGIRMNLTYDSLTGQPVIQFELKDEKEAFISVGQLFEFIQQQKKRYLFAIDEFQQILNYPEKNVEALLRTHIQKTKNATFVFAGSQKHMLLSMFGTKNRPFYQSTELLHLEKIDADDYLKFATGLFKKGKIDITLDSLSYVLEWTKKYTYYTQYVFNKIFSKGKSCYSLEDIKEILLEILIENETLYYNFRNLFTEYQWNLLRAIAKEGSVKMITSKEFISKHRLNTPSSVKTGVMALISKEIIYKENGSYEIYDVFFERWLERL